MPRHAPARRSFLGLSLGLAIAALAGPALGHTRLPQPPYATLEVYDRSSGETLAMHAKDGRSYVVGTPGHEYAVRIRNTTGGRVLAVTSVDGVNVVTGETASPDQSGYVLEPWGTVEIGGWRKSLDRTAAFYFSEHAQSYAARTGRPFDVGVIGVAVFAEKRPVISRIADPKREAQRAEATADAAAPAASAEAPAPAEGARSAAPSAPGSTLAQPQAKLGTGHGRSETSVVRRVAFERATTEPGQVIAVQYDRLENLVALGVIEAPRVARSPRPFPGMRFVPDPR